MKTEIKELDGGFWNLRGSFHIAGIDIGTHSSLLRLSDGQFIILDSYTLTDNQRALVRTLTDEGRLLKAVINLHPYHTVHVERMFQDFPEASHFGTQRHHDRFPELNWQPLLTEQLEADNPFKDDVLFSCPKGVGLVTGNENVHFASVMAFHKPSRTIHVDDTLMILQAPYAINGLLTKIGIRPLIQFHPTLALALKKQPKAAEEFEIWVNRLIDSWGKEANNVCAAHSGVSLNVSGHWNIARQIQLAKMLVKPVLMAHQLIFR